MKFQVSTLAAFGVLSATAKATTKDGISEDNKGNKKAADSVLSGDASGDFFVPRKLIRNRKIVDEALVGKTLKNTKNLERELEQVVVDDLDEDLGILDDDRNESDLTYEEAYQLSTFSSDDDEDDIRMLQATDDDDPISDDPISPSTAPPTASPTASPTGSPTAAPTAPCEADDDLVCWEPEIIDCNAYCDQFAGRPKIDERKDDFKSIVTAYINGESFYDGPINCWDTSEVTDMSYGVAATVCRRKGAGFGCGGFRSDEERATLRLFNSPVGCWDTSAVTNMAGLFHQSSSFNQPLNTWDFSSVTTMERMLKGSAFNHPVDDWDTSSNTNTRYMFMDTKYFNQSVDNLVTSTTNNVWHMFQRAAVFNQPVDTWDTSSVTEMRIMFDGAAAFNQPVDAWDVSSVRNMRKMFAGAGAFNQAVNDWNTSAVTDMGGMFNRATSFNRPVDLWDTSRVTNMGSGGFFTGMFQGASSFNQPVNDWDVSSVYFFGNMFAFASSFDQRVNDWDTSNARQMNGMFGYTPFNHPVDSFDTSKVQRMDSMFQDATAFNQPVDSFDISNVSRMREMFSGATSFNQCLSSWPRKAPITVDTRSMFEDSSCPLQDDPAALFSAWCQGADICEPTFPIAFRWSPGVDCNDYCNQFEGRPAIQRTSFGRDDLIYGLLGNSNYGPVTNCWDTSRVTSMVRAFYDRYAYSPSSNVAKFNFPLGCWDVSSVTDMEEMFTSAKFFNQPIDDWDVSNVTNMKRMFAKQNFVAAENVFNQCLSTWAGKTPDNVITTGMLDTTDCPVPVECPVGNFDDDPVCSDGPNPAVGPWCQGGEDSCFEVTRSPTITPPPTLAPASNCKDDESFKKKNKNCEDFLKRGDLEKKCNKKYKKKKVFDFCKKSCAQVGLGECVVACEAEDDETFSYKGKSCDEYLAKNAQTKCVKERNGKLVYEWCPKTCGEKADVGECSQDSLAATSTPTPLPSFRPGNFND